MKVISTPNAPQAIGPYSQAMVTGDDGCFVNEQAAVFFV